MSRGWDRTLNYGQLLEDAMCGHCVGWDGAVRMLRSASDADSIVVNGLVSGCTSGLSLEFS